MKTTSIVCDNCNYECESLDEDGLTIVEICEYTEKDGVTICAECSEESKWV